ncbi:MAG: hypothetical protein AB8G96_07780 [Phycisphaerales bacterium]
MEGREHLALKRLAAAWLRSEGFPAVGFEVTGPIGRHRVDVAAWSDRHGEPGAALTVFVECKASRSDFVRDRQNAERLQRERAEVDAQRQRLERTQLPRNEPELRVAGASLFPDLDEWAFEHSRDPEYRSCMRRLRRLDARLHGETKFFHFERYRVADRLFIAAPIGVIRPRDIPPGWGLLEAAPDALALIDGQTLAERGPGLFGDSALRVRVRAPAIRRAARRFRDRTLRNIAVAGTRAAFEQEGVARSWSPAGGPPAPPKRVEPDGNCGGGERTGDEGADRQAAAGRRADGRAGDGRGLGRTRPFVPPVGVWDPEATTLPPSSPNLPRPLSPLSPLSPPRPPRPPGPLGSPSSPSSPRPPNPPSPSGRNPVRPRVAR